MQQLSFDELTERMMNLYGQEKYADALQIVEQNADHFPEYAVRTTFWKMCLLSLCGRLDDVISVFQQGLDSGLWWAERQFRDSDLDAVRDLPEFKRLAATSQKNYEEARTRVKRDQTVLLPEASAPHPLLIALHGGAGTKDSNLAHWELARQRGWLVLIPQSTQPLYSGSYSWIEPEQGMVDILYYVEKVSQEHSIDSHRVVIAGFSQGSGMAIHAALSGKISMRGFLAVGPYWADLDSLASLVKHAKPVRGYFITGGKDNALSRIREIQNILRGSHIQFEEEFFPDLGHEFPVDFGSSFDKGIDFIFKEQE